MLHELLLSLSGHPSPLLDRSSDIPESLRTLVSPAELALLESLAGDLGQKHKSIRDDANTISSSHPSTVCRAVASAIISVHLAAFQQRILEVERDILKEDASLVGAYNIVPLSAVVGSFEGWGRKLEWLQELVHFIRSPASHLISETQNGRQACTAAILIGRLRESMHTGYPDIEEMSMNLTQVSEMAWLKLLSAWVLYGRHPGEEDYFVESIEKNTENLHSSKEFRIRESLLPAFVTSNAANSVLFIGKSLNHIRELQKPERVATPNTSTPEVALLPAHLAHLSSLQSPITSARFSAAINAIRLSLSQNALQKLLPISKVMDLLYILKDFFLLERGEFAVALITSADDRLNTKNRRDNSSSRTAPTLEDSLASMTIKEGEVHAVLSRTWAALASFHGDQDDEDIDEELDRAREIIHLSIKSIESSSARPRNPSQEKVTVFEDLLLPSSTTLNINIPSPLNLFLTTDDTELYSRIHAYLLAIRRAHLRLSKLFLLSKLRRDYPCPRAPPNLPQKEQLSTLEQKRQLSNHRTKALRPVWATIGSATFFFAELSEYFQGEVIQRSWTAFHSWLLPELPNDRPNSSSNSTPPPHPPSSSSSTSISTPPNKSSRPPSSRAKNLPLNTPTRHDPETLTIAHNRFLSHLTHSLLLSHSTFTRPLRRLMTSVDHLIALLHRLHALQTNLDALPPNSSTDTDAGLAKEEVALLADLRDALPPISKGVHDLVEILRGIDESRHLSGSSTAPVSGEGKAGRMVVEGDEMRAGAMAVGQEGGRGFEPWTSRSLERLLLRFDFGDVEEFLGRGGVEGL